MRDHRDTSGRLKSRGSIEENWEQTVRLYQRLAGAGYCGEEAVGDVGFSLDEHEGIIRIYDCASDWGPIGSWTSEGGFYVLCMENHKRPFHKLRSIADAVAICMQLTKLPLDDRKKFHPPLRTPYANYD